MKCKTCGGEMLDVKNNSETYIADIDMALCLTCGTLYNKDDDRWTPPAIIPLVKEAIKHISLGQLITTANMPTTDAERLARAEISGYNRGIRWATEQLVAIKSLLEGKHDNRV